MKEILFVCTGNTCRSAMAEAIFNSMAAKRSLPAHASSCGLAAFPGDAAAPEAVAAAAEFGADLAAHRARRLNPHILELADRVYCMTRAHLNLLKATYPEHSEKASLLDEADIPDPWGADAETYRRTAKTLARLIEKLLYDFGEQDEV
jgi:protein-tyrosine-phosphatase